MKYSINEVANKFGISVHTIRFYEKEGLFPFIKRNNSGNREFSDSDLDWVKLVCCLKNTGMKIKDIHQYVDWCMKGNDTIDIRKDLLVEHRKEVLQQIESLQKNLQLIDFKISHYESCNAIPKSAEEK